MRRVCFVAGLVAMLSFGFAGSAKADTVTIDGVQFVGTVTGTEVDLSVTCTEPGCANYAIGSISLKGFTFTGPASNIMEPPGYMVQNGAQDNGGSANCNKTQLQGAVCWNANGAFIAIGTGLTFEALIANGMLGTDLLHVQTVIFSDSSGDTRVTGVSNDLNGDIITTPEPASLTFLGLGLLGVPFFRRKK